jgi:hypothetical protein
MQRNQRPAREQFVCSGGEKDIQVYTNKKSWCFTYH